MPNTLNRVSREEYRYVPRRSSFPRTAHTVHSFVARAPPIGRTVARNRSSQGTERFCTSSLGGSSLRGYCTTILPTEGKHELRQLARSSCSLIGLVLLLQHSSRKGASLRPFLPFKSPTAHFPPSRRCVQRLKSFDLEGKTGTADGPLHHQTIGSSTATEDP